MFEQFKHKKTKYDEQKSIILNPATINNIAYTIRAFFKYLIDFYNYPKNPLSAYKALKTKEHSVTHSLNRSELLDIINEAKNEYMDSLYNSSSDLKVLTRLRDYLIFSLLSLSLRREEICNIKWDDLKENSFFHIMQK